jgi:hypothetical protein
VTAAPTAAPNAEPLSGASFAPPEQATASRAGLYVGALVAIAATVVAIIAALQWRAPTRHASSSAPGPTFGPRPSAPAPTPASNASHAPNEGTVRVRIETNPADADLLIDGLPVANPYDADLPVSNSVHVIQARAPGFRTYLLDVVLQFPQRITIQMRAGDGVDDHRRTGGPDAR